MDWRVSQMVEYARHAMFSEEDSRKSLVVVVMAVTLATASSIVLAQSGDVSAKSAAEVAKASADTKKKDQRKRDFAE